jgi:hypothetical protein
MCVRFYFKTIGNNSFLSINIKYYQVCLNILYEMKDTSLFLKLSPT